MLARVAVVAQDAHASVGDTFVDTQLQEIAASQTKAMPVHLSARFIVNRLMGIRPITAVDFCLIALSCSRGQETLIAPLQRVPDFR